MGAHARWQIERESEALTIKVVEAAPLADAAYFVVLGAFVLAAGLLWLNGAPTWIAFVPGLQMLLTIIFVVDAGSRVPETELRWLRIPPDAEVQADGLKIARQEIGPVAIVGLSVPSGRSGGPSSRRTSWVVMLTFYSESCRIFPGTFSKEEAGTLAELLSRALDRPVISPTGIDWLSWSLFPMTLGATALAVGVDAILLYWELVYHFDPGGIATLACLANVAVFALLMAAVRRLRRNLLTGLVRSLIASRMPSLPS